MQATAVREVVSDQAGGDAASIAASDHQSSWRSECARYLGDHIFPARQDDLLAALVHQRAPSRILHHLARLDPRTVYATLADVLADCVDTTV